MVAHPMASAGQRPQTCEPRLDVDLDELVHEFAPTVRFAPEERFFPTLPLLTALDLQDRGGERGVIDPDDIVGLTASGGVDWREMAETLAQSDDPKGRSVVSYRAHELVPAEVQRLEAVVKSYSQLRRVPVRLFGNGSCLEGARWVVVEYYLQYLDDRGLTGHPEDIEFAFVFLPLIEDPPAIVVGGAHSSRDANNVAIMAPEELMGVERINLLVELGGHATAPDRRPFGHYTAGYDTNWFPKEAWGIRDIVSSAGLGFMGGHRRGQFIERVDGVTPVLRIRPRHDACRNSERCSNAGPYDLVPVSVLVLVDSILDDELSTADDVESALDSLSAFLPWATAPDLTTNANLLPRLRLVNRNARRIAEHTHYKRGPTAIFKRHVFPRRLFLDGGTVTAGWAHAGGEYSGHFGTSLDVTQALLGVVSVPGELEITTGLDNRVGRGPDLGWSGRVIYQQRHVPWLTWFAGVEYRHYDRLARYPGYRYTIQDGPLGDASIWTDSVYVVRNRTGRGTWMPRGDVDNRWSGLVGATITPFHFVMPDFARRVLWLEAAYARARVGADISADLTNSRFFFEPGLGLDLVGGVSSSLITVYLAVIAAFGLVSGAPL